MNTNNGEQKCGCGCHKAPGIMLALFGLNFLLKHAGVYSEDISNWVWPILLIVAGIAKSGMCKCCKKDCKPQA